MNRWSVVMWIIGVGLAACLLASWVARPPLHPVRKVTAAERARQDDARPTTLSSTANKAKSVPASSRTKSKGRRPFSPSERIAPDQAVAFPVDI